MSSRMLQLTLLVLVVAVATIYIVFGGKRADRARRSRFTGREDLSVDRLYDEHYKALGFDREKVLKALNDVAQAIDVPVTKLRPADRFDVELASERGWEFDDGIGILSGRLAKRGRKSGSVSQQSPRIQTLDDYIKTAASR